VSGLRVLYLGKSSPVLDYLKDVESMACQWERPTEELIHPGDTTPFDFLVSYGYRHKIPADVLALFPHRAVNLHPSYLPYNRGRYPNAWGWYDGTPQGVTIHELDAEWDTGPILAQQRVTNFPTPLTLASTYHWLESALARLFLREWRSIREGWKPATPQPAEGVRHTAADFERSVRPLLTDGWRTPVQVLREAGRKARGE
jgi:methionyl-tRNA formyltransferase